MPDTLPIPAKPSAHAAPDWLGAVYLAVSWTWCIGIFLPVILVRDFGITGWIVFAVPNVVGAAAFGWFVRGHNHVDLLLAAHRPALIAFSLITIAFQVFFVTWFFGLLNMLPAVAACLIVAGTVRILGESRPSFDRVAAALAMVISLAILFWWMIHLADAPTWSDFSSHVFFRPAIGVIGLFPACAFGFALCPYLDLTFHAARRDQSGHAARQTFAWGFGFFFLLMIVLSLAYAPAVAAAINGQPTSPRLLRLVAVHIALQIGLTIAFHARAALRHLPQRRGPAVLSTTVGAGILIGIVALLVDRTGTWHPGAGEMTYRLFMSFYGLIFPAYVWICLLPSLRNPLPPTTRRLRIATLALVLAAPQFAMGFLAGRMFWLLPGVAVVLLARLLAWQKTPGGPIITPAAN